MKNWQKQWEICRASTTAMYFGHVCVFFLPFLHKDWNLQKRRKFCIVDTCMSKVRGDVVHSSAQRRSKQEHQVFLSHLQATAGECRNCMGETAGVCRPPRSAMWKFFWPHTAKEKRKRSSRFQLNLWILLFGIAIPSFFDLSTRNRSLQMRHRFQRCSQIKEMQRTQFQTFGLQDRHTNVRETVFPILIAKHKVDRSFVLNKSCLSYSFCISLPRGKGELSVVNNWPIITPTCFPKEMIDLFRIQISHLDVDSTCRFQIPAVVSEFCIFRVGIVGRCRECLQIKALSLSCNSL